MQGLAFRPRTWRSTRWAVALLTLFFLGTSAAEASAQGTIQGRVTDTQSGGPIISALITVANEQGRTVATVLSSRDGSYTASVPAGTYELSISAIGYGTQRMGSITVAAGAVARLDYQAASRAVELNPVVVSVGRDYEKAISAPARVEVVSAEQIRARPATTPVDHLRSVPGIDVIQQGVQSTNVVARGFNNIFSGSLHALTDNRIAGVPSLRVNVLSFIPTADDDIERMEVVLGPGSALYGPNTANGVLHIMTRSPLREQGSSLTVTGGEQSIFGGSFRTAQRLGDRLGVKVSGQFFRAEEWTYVDPVEVAEAQKFASNIPFWRQDMMRSVGISQAEADRRIARIGDRDPEMQRWSGEIRADYALTDDATAIFTVGRSNAGRQVELTGLGAAQVEDWSYTFYQARLNWNRLFAQFYSNQSDAGTTYLLRNGAPIVDRSTLLVGQLQHGLDLGTRQRFTYGFDYLYTNPETEGSINGIYEDEDDTTEVGAYLQSETRLTSQLNLVLAGRIDSHSALPENIFSPRAALVWEPIDGQAFRATYNRAFSTPSSLTQFLDLGTAVPNTQLAQLGYSVRVQGTGDTGFRFRQANGGFLMRSPFTPGQIGGPAQLIPANAATFWDAAVAVVAQGAQLPPQIVGLLQMLNPANTGGQVGTAVLDINTGQVTPIASLDRPDLDPVRESLQTTYEVGYKGILGDRLLVAADVWSSRRRQLVTSLTVQTPLVLLDGPSLGAYLVPQLVPALMMGGMPQAQAQATALAIVQGMAGVPLGVISSPDINANGAQLLSTYTNVDEDFDVWGVDVGGTFLLNDTWALGGSLSYVNEDIFTTASGLSVPLNAPGRKGTVSVNYRNPAAGFSAEGRARFAAGFPASSGVYAGDVESSTLMDVNFSYRIPMVPATTLQLSIQNILDESFQSFPGVPAIGRTALLRLRYDF
jgi:outer membrane receptor for ferrienterochelin and colicins